MRSLTCLCLLLGFLPLTSFGHAATIALNWDQDTVIDANNSFPEPPDPDSLLVTVVDGLDGPTNVELDDGGVIGGVVRLRENSHLNMTGGGIEALVTLFDDSSFTLGGGTIQPLIRGYQSVDVTGVLRVTDQATLNLRGGSFFGTISQEESSVINIYGHNFVTQGEFPNATQQPAGVRVQGVYADGALFDITIIRRSFNAKVYLHIVPEPETIFSFLLLIAVLIADQRLYRRT